MPFPSSKEWGRAGREECGVWAGWKEGRRVFQLPAQSLCTQGHQLQLCPCKPAAPCRRETSAALQSKIKTQQKKPHLPDFHCRAWRQEEYWWGMQLGAHGSILGNQLCLLCDAITMGTAAPAPHHTRSQHCFCHEQNQLQVLCHESDA